MHLGRKTAATSPPPQRGRTRQGESLLDLHHGCMVAAALSGSSTWMYVCSFAEVGTDSSTS